MTNHDRRCPSKGRMARSGFSLAVMLAIVIGTALSALPSVALAQEGPDSYEDDNLCADATAISTDGVAQNHNLFRDPDADRDWVKFEATAATRYLIVAQPDGDNGADADLAIVLYPQCDDIEIVRADGKLNFSAEVDGDFYVQVKHRQDEYGDRTAYLLSVTEKTLPPRSMPLAEVPTEIHRRAADFVDELRGSELAPNWTEARFVEEVSILYRPDLGDKPAYYEFPLEAPGANGAYEPAGFVQLAADDHDYPITHWSPEGVSPTQEMESAAALGENEVNQFFKLDALSYTAEYDQPGALGANVQADDVIRLGNLPPKADEDIVLPLTGDPIVEEGDWTPEIASDDEVDPDNPVSTDLVVTGDDIPASLAGDSWESWDELKSEYASNYAVLLDALEKEASTDWSQEEMISSEGEGLVKGDVRVVRALAGKDVEEITVEGEGADAQYMQVDEIAATDLPQGVQLSVLDGPVDNQTALPVAVKIKYAGGEEEVRKYVVITTFTSAIYLPSVSSGSGSAQAASVGASDAINGSWGSWQYWWSGSPSANSITYNQLPKFQAPNNTACWSGCVPTAWAMMFAWADIKASQPNSGWNHRWGIYRTNGGYGANAVAPYSMYGAAESPGIHNVMMELNGQMGTFCSSGSGATYTNRMHEAHKYLKNRTGAKLHYKRTSGWWIFGTSADEVRNYAISTVKSGKPVVIAREGHAPLVTGYKERSRKVKACFLCWWSKTEYQRYFYVNQGWGGSSNGWVSAKATFAGTLSPN